MIPLSDGMRALSFPFVNVAIIAWIFYELLHLNSSVFHASFYPFTPVTSGSMWSVDSSGP